MKELQSLAIYLAESAGAVQNPDGSLEAVTPEEARDRLAAMVPETRAHYELVER